MTEHKKPNYMGVFAALFIFTVLEVFVAFLPVSKGLLIFSLVALAATKAILVALFYMHLKFEGRLIYGIVLTPLILAVVLTLAILQDASQLY
jgi:cytochrome c oxidase subunit IV